MPVAGLADISTICTPLELLTIKAPSDQTCGQYLGPCVQNFGGRVLNPDVKGDCLFCPVAETNDALAALGFSYGQRWRDLGFMLWQGPSSSTGLRGVGSGEEDSGGKREAKNLSLLNLVGGRIGF